MKKRKNILKVAIDSPAAAGAGTQAKLISSYYNLYNLDTGKIYRLIAYLKLKQKEKFNLSFVKKKIKNLKIQELNKKVLKSDKIGFLASKIASSKKFREIVHNFQINCAYNPPAKFAGSCLDGRDITYKIIPDANIKLFITANLKVRAKRRYLELKSQNAKISLKEVTKSIKKRDKNDYNRRISPLKKTNDSILINTSNLTKKACFLKIKKIIDKKLIKYGNL